MAYTPAQQRQIIRDNLRSQEREIAEILEARISHLSDLSELLFTTLGDAAPTPASLRILTADAPLLSPTDRATHRELLPQYRPWVMHALSQLAVYDRVVLCRLLLDRLSAAERTLTMPAFLGGTSSPRGVAYYRNALTDEAFAAFSAVLSSPRPISASDYLDSCAMVEAGDADACILPLTTTGGERAESVLSLLRSYGLLVSATRVVLNGEDSPTGFALCTRFPTGEPESPALMLSFPDGEPLDPSALTEAAVYAGMRITRLIFDRRLRLEACGGDPLTYLVYLTLFHPEYRVDGYYNIES